jgi:hypothetical protein
MAVFTKERPDYLGCFSAAPAVPGSSETLCGAETCPDNNADMDIAEIYFLVMNFLSSGPCHLPESYSLQVVTPIPTE